MMQKFMKQTALFITIMAMGVVLAGCANSESTNNGKISIVATTNFYGEVAKAVVGNKGSVKSIINKPAVDPHDFEPTTDTAKKVSRADIVIANGLGYDSWMNKLVNNSDDHQYIKVGEQIMHLKTGDNPHVWYNPTTMEKLANYLAKQLGKQQPQNKQYFAKNAQKYIKSLKPMKNELNQLKQTAKGSNIKKVYVSEPIFDYSIEAIGFKVANREFENSIEKGTDPSVKSISTMQQGIKHRQIRFLVDNKQVSSTTVTNFVKLAKRHNIPVLKVTETRPAHMTYVEWMTSQYRQLNQILK